MLSRTVLALAALLLPSCQAEHPPINEGQPPPKGQGPHATLAVCTPTVPCPGQACAENAIGPPDGLGVDLVSCATLDVVFTGGTIFAGEEIGTDRKPDLDVVLTREGGRTLVEGSSDGTIYEILGFIGSLPAGAADSCLAEVKDLRASLYLDRCHHMANVRHLRLTRDPVVSGSPAVDAFEALSFRPAVDAAR